MFGLKYPTYGLTLNPRLPIKNHGAEADLADALARCVVINIARRALRKPSIWM
jgi:hypothetical protein